MEWFGVFRETMSRSIGRRMQSSDRARPCLSAKLPEPAAQSSPSADRQRRTAALSAFRGTWLGGLVMEVASETVLRLADDASVQHVGDGAVVLLARSGQLYTCNGTTEAFLDKVDGARSLDQIVGLLSAEFEIDKDTLDQDMAALASDLLSEGILAAPDA